MTPGTIVKVTRGSAGPWGGGARAGDIGRVVTGAGFFSPRVQIELTSGARVWVGRKHVRRTAAQGDRAWEAQRDWANAKFWAGAITLIVVLIPGVWYCVHGGTPALYALGIAEGFGEMLLRWLLGPCGLFLAFGLLAWWKLRASARR
jgi:hypothetical protein